MRNTQVTYKTPGKCAMKGRKNHSNLISSSPTAVHPLKTALLLTAFYLAVGAIYIFIFGRFAADTAQTVEELAAIELMKGLIYIATTSLLLFLFSLLLFRRIAAHEMELNAYRNELIEAERRATAGIFASSVAHDINNVLIITDYMTDQLKNSDKPDHEIQAKLKEATQQMTALVKKIQEAGCRTTEEDTGFLNLTDSIKDIVSFARSHKKLRNHHIRLDAPSSVPFTGKEVLIHQMILNLLLNAAEATQSNGEILIRLGKTHSTVHIEVHDNGPGISPQAQEKIMQPFTTTKTRGSGLGLLSVKARAEAHNGEVTIGKSELGGACFNIHLTELPLKQNHNYR